MNRHALAPAGRRASPGRGRRRTRTRRADHSPRTRSTSGGRSCLAFPGRLPERQPPRRIRLHERGSTGTGRGGRRPPGGWPAGRFAGTGPIREGGMADRPLIRVVAKGRIEPPARGAIRRPTVPVILRRDERISDRSMAYHPSCLPAAAGLPCTSPDDGAQYTLASGFRAGLIEAAARERAMSPRHERARRRRHRRRRHARRVDRSELARAPRRRRRLARAHGATGGVVQGVHAPRVRATRVVVPRKGP